MLAVSLYIFIGGYAVFLLGFAVFMYFENQKFGDNQFTIKLLPPPVKSASARTLEAAILRQAPAVPDWTPVPDRAPAPVRGERLSRAA